MMKHHISNGLPFEYTTNCKKFDQINSLKVFFIDEIRQENTDEDIEDENEQSPMPVIYKKRARVKFTQEQVEK